MVFVLMVASLGCSKSDSFNFGLRCSMVVKNNTKRRVTVTKSLSGRLSLSWSGEQNVKPVLLQVRKANGSSKVVQTLQAE